MLIEILIGSVLLYYAARYILELKVKDIARAIWRLMCIVNGIVAGIRKYLMTMSRREELEAMQQAQWLYDSTLCEIFSKATAEEKQTILDIFSRYAPSH